MKKMMGVNYGMKKHWYVIVLVASIVLMSSCVIQIPFPPEPPSNLEAEALSSTEIKLTWTDNSTNEEGFEIERKTGVEEWNLIKTVEADIREYRDSELSTSTTYYYRIRSYNTRGYSNYSNTATVTTNTPPTKPTNLNPANGASGVSVTPTLSWDESTDDDGDDVTYDLYLGTDEENLEEDPVVKVSDLGTNSYTFTTEESLKYEATYYWKVIAKDGRGGETSGDVWSFKTEVGPTNTPPTKPTNLNPANGASGVSVTPTLSWDESTDDDGDDVTYDLYLGTDEENLEEDPVVKVSDLGTNSYTFTTEESLKYEATYYWKVIAKDGRGGETSGDVWSFKTEVGPTNTPPTKPTNLNPANGASGVSVTPTLSWDESTDDDGDDVTYDLYLGTDEENLEEDPVVKVSDLGTNSYTFTTEESLKYEATYYWKVIAKDGRGGKTSSDVWSFTTMPKPNTPPTKPTNPDPEDGASGVSVTPTLSWDESTDDDGDDVTYDLYLGTDEENLEENPIVEESDLGTNSYTFTTEESLKYEMTYYWKVVAKDGRGGQTEGPVWSFTTMEEPNTPPSEPTNPDPEDGETGVLLTPTLRWDESTDEDGDDVTYDLYLGRDEENLEEEPVVKVSDLGTNSYDFEEQLDYEMTYYWKVIAKDGRGGETSSDVWSFKTREKVNLTLEKEIPLKINLISGPIYSSPAVGDDGNIYIGTQGGYVVLSSSGQISDTQPSSPVWASPSLDPREDKAYFGDNNGYLHIYPSGEKYRYRSSLFSPFYSIYAAPVITDSYIYIVNLGGQIFKVSKAKPDNTLDVVNIKKEVRSSPVLYDGNLFIATVDGYVYSINASTMKINWQKDLTDNFYGGFAIDTFGNLYIAGNTLHKLNSNDGSEIWKYELNSQAYSNPIISLNGFIIYVGDKSGTLHAVDFSSDLFWKKDELGSILCSGVIGDDNVIYISGGTLLYAIDAVNGEILDSIELRSFVESNPVLHNGKIYIADEAGYLYIIGVSGDSIQDPDFSWPMFQKDCYHSATR
jgi:outer membrane protein assembly factor BamB